MIVIFAIMVAAADQAQASGGYGEDVGVLEKISPAAANFAMNVDSVLRDYDCSRAGDKDCAIWTAATILEHMEQGDTNCDSAKDSDDCQKAISILGDTGLTNADMQLKLADIAKQMADADHDKLLNVIYAAVADFLCYRQPITCDSLKALMGDVADLEAGGDF